METLPFAPQSRSIQLGPGRIFRPFHELGAPSAAPFDPLFVLQIKFREDAETGPPGPGLGPGGRRDAAVGGARALAAPQDH